MQNYTSSAIIMRVKEFGESDLLVTFFTKDNGRLKGIAKGARRSRKRFVNCLDIFSLVNIEYGRKRKGDLYFIHSGRLIDAYPGLRADFSTLSKASFMVELTEILFPWELPDQNIFEILRKSFQMLDKAKKSDLIPVIFEIMAMSHGGYSINLEKCCLCGRIYKGDGVAVFKPENGGIACTKCQQITAITPGMSPSTVNITRLAQAQSPTIFKEIKNTEDDVISELRPVLKLHREYHLGCRPKSAYYLE
jgi:DNA repair protein RecO (recombination protein O)